MPTYDYKCESCGRTFEYFQSMNDPRLETCIFDDCKGPVKRLLGTGAGIIFKGSGFYQTDYRSESYKAGEKAAGDKSGSGDKKEKKESKSAETSTSSATKNETKSSGEAKKGGKSSSGSSSSGSGTG